MVLLFITQLSMPIIVDVLYIFYLNAHLFAHFFSLKYISDILQSGAAGSFPKFWSWDWIAVSPVSVFQFRMLSSFPKTCKNLPDTGWANLPP